MNGLQTLLELQVDHDRGKRSGITPLCSAHPLVIQATLQEAAEFGHAVLIDATCNQVNQDGGHTGIKPADFRDVVCSIATEKGFPKEGILFGGHHLGPNPWRHFPANIAMEKAIVMIAEYARAGFSKIHLDASMACADDAGRC